VVKCHPRLVIAGCVRSKYRLVELVWSGPLCSSITIAREVVNKVFALMTRGLSPMRRIRSVELKGSMQRFCAMVSCCVG
jgi:hypothetical protein